MFFGGLSGSRNSLTWNNLLENRSETNLSCQPTRSQSEYRSTLTVHNAIRSVWLVQVLHRSSSEPALCSGVGDQHIDMPPMLFDPEKMSRFHNGLPCYLFTAVTRLGDQKAIRMVKNLASAILEGSSLRNVQTTQSGVISRKTNRLNKNRK